MTRLTHLLSLCLIGLATPALAQMTLSVEEPSDGVSTPSLELSAPPDTSSSEPLSHMSAPPSLEMSAPDEELPAEPAELPVPSRDALTAFFSICTDVSGGDPEAYDRASGSGWTVYDGVDTGPYKNVFAGSQSFAGYGSVELWSSVESYPTQQLGYCRVDFPDYDTRIDFKDMAGIGGLTGMIEDRGAGNVYGIWETADHKVLVIADRTEGEVEIEFNVLIGAKPQN
ncbi:MAG: hypothetical protein HY834_08470 [Devosia nanyangense]|uniref:Uncharacterized protein n=1 Tax=Devosia nanyangense TaxID=1228055 RepID=A0A933NY09_9HYPH|nr:hypothetical protein [Devosia nanyangense]